MAYENRLDDRQALELDGVELVRDFPPVPTKPDMKISWNSPDYYMYEGKPSGFGHFGTIARMANGDIVAVYQEQVTGTHYANDPSRRDVCRLSCDGGYTWSESTVIGTEPRIHQSVCPLSDGSIWLASVQKPDGRYYIPRSSDNGKTWNFDLEGVKNFVRAIQMSNGEIIAASAGVDEDGQEGRAVVITDPEGSKWETIFLKDQCGYQRDEWWLTETAEPGVLYALLRDQSQSNYLSQAWSRDYGRTWEGYSPSGVWFSPRPSRPYVTKLPDGTLVGIHSERGHGRIIAIPSFDGGKNWYRDAGVVVLDGINGWLTESHGYCSAAYTNDDLLLVAWYAGARSEMDPECKGRALYASHIDPRYFRRPGRGVRLAAEPPAAGLPAAGKPAAGKPAAISAVTDPNLICRWSFEEESRTAGRPDPCFDSVSGNYGRTTRVGRSDGKIGGSLRFNGRDSFVEIPDAPDMRVPNFFTLECFFRAESTGAMQALISKRPYYYLGLGEDRLSFQIGDPQNRGMPLLKIESGNEIEPNRWYHAAASLGIPSDGYVHARLYLDGVKVADVKPAEHGMRQENYKTGSGSYYVDAKPEFGPLYHEYAVFSGYQVISAMNLYLGADNITQRDFYSGDLDEVALYRRCLLDRDIAALAKRSYPTERSGFVTSAPIVQEGHGWGLLRAETDEPSGTEVVFSLLDENGRTLKTELKSNDTLADVEELSVRLRAELKTNDPSVSPTLRLWGMYGVIDE